MAEITVQGLIDYLTEQVEYDESLAERPIHVQHQESYPLILEIDGFYDPQSDDAKSAWLEGSEDEELVDFSKADDAWDHEVAENAQRKPVYLVLGGHPYDLNPYGTKEAWELVERIR